jgi:hypothetical protein
MMTIQDLFRVGMDREIPAVVDYNKLDVIIRIVERNLCLMTQLIRTPEAVVMADGRP